MTDGVSQGEMWFEIGLFPGFSSLEVGRLGCCGPNLTYTVLCWKSVFLADDFATSTACFEIKPSHE